MSIARAFATALLVAPLLLAGCSSDTASNEDAAPEDEALTGSALVGTVTEGATLATTTRVNFRQVAEIKAGNVMRVLPAGALVRVLSSQPENGFVNVEEEGDEGWVFARYLKAATSGDDDATLAPSSPSPTSSGTGTGQIESCKASFYDEGQQTANGERFDPSALTAAHKTLKFNTMVRVTNNANGKTVDVRINDRGPFVAGRCIDLSRAAFQHIASTSAGVASVTLEVLR